MTQDVESAPLMRRLGDVIQTIAVLAIVGLAVAVIDLRLTMVEHQTKISAQDEMYHQQLISLKGNIELQMKVLEAIVQRVTADRFHGVRGTALEESVESLTKRVDAQDVKIFELYQMVVTQISNEKKNKSN